MPSKWFGEKVSRQFTNEMRARLMRAGDMYSGYATQSMRQNNIKGDNPSSPGGFPALVSHHLRKNITYEVDPHPALTGRWGTNVPYGKWLEMGVKPHVISVKSAKVLANKKLGKVFGKRVTVSLPRRPWMTLTNSAMQGRVGRMLGKKLTGSQA